MNHQYIMGLQLISRGEPYIYDRGTDFTRRYTFQIRETIPVLLCWQWENFMPKKKKEEEAETGSNRLDEGQDFVYEEHNRSLEVQIEVSMCLLYCLIKYSIVF